MIPASRRLLLVALLAGAGLTLAGGGCDNVDTGDPAPADDDDDDGGTPSGTPTQTPTGSPTGTPTPSPSLSGDPWTATADPAQDACALGTIQLQFGNAGTAVIGVATTGNDLYFDIGLGLDPTLAVVQEPSGTIDASGNFTQTFVYCALVGASTRKYVGTWTGTFDSGMTSFDSTLTEQIYLENGDLRAMCASVDDAPFNDCVNPGLTFSVTGVKQ